MVGTVHSGTGADRDALNPRLFWIDSLRGIAVSAVVMRHFFAHLVNADVLTYFDPGVFGVTLFFCVSGYIIPLSVKAGNNRLSRFIIARVFRLYPAYWLSLIVGVVVFGGHFTSIAVNFTMFQRFLGGHDLLGVYWTLQVEITFYMFVALTLLLNLFNRPKIIVTAMFLMALLALVFGMVRFYLNQKTPIYLPVGLCFIFFGNTAHLMKTGLLTSGRFYALSVAMYVLLSLSFWFGFRQDWGDGESISRYLITDLIATILFLLVITRERLNLHILSWIGVISYPLYLLHEPLRVLVLRNAPSIAEIHILIIALVIIISISAATHYFAERPLLGLGRKLARRFA